MQAIILAGGIGTRLQPLTQELPKPMVPVLNKPLMEYSVELLKKHGITDIGVTLMFLPQYIKNYFGSGEKWDVNISYFEEEKPLGTAGSVKLAKEKLNDTFVVVSGDALTDIDLTKILKYHKAINADVTIVLSKQEDPLEYGVVLTDITGKVTAFCEKPQWESVVSNTVNTGIYLIEKKVLEKIPENREFDFSKDLFPVLLKENFNVYGYITEDFWSDLGNPQSYLKANTDILQGRVFGKKYENTLEENIILSENTKLIPPVYIGKNTVISGECTIGPNVIIGENSIIENSHIDNSVLWNKVLINNTNFSEGVIADNCKLERSILSGQNIIGSNVKLNKNSHLKYGTKIYNNVEISENSILDGTVFKGNKKNKNLWGDNGIIGIWNHHILPKHLLGIASSYSTNKIVICANKTTLSTSIANLLASYFSLCGTDVYLSTSNEASCRFFSSVNKIKGIYIFEKNENINIQIIDEKGLNIPHGKEKNIDFEKNNFSIKCGRVIRLNSVDKDFEYFLNASIPFCRDNVQIYAEEKFRLHNLIWENSDFNGALNRLSSGAVKAGNNTITDAYDKDGRLSTTAFLRLKIDLVSFLGGKKVFLPPFTPDEIIKEAEDRGLIILRGLQHKGDSMQQAENFNSVEVLLEYVPAFFAQAFAFYLSKNKTPKDNGVLISRYDFEIEPQSSCRTIFALNQNKVGDLVTAQYKNSFITIIPRNNGYSFSAYGKFMKEEYAPDIVEEFISSKLTDNVL